MSEREHSKTIYSDGKSITETWPCGCTCGGCKPGVSEFDARPVIGEQSSTREEVVRFVYQTTGDEALAKTAELLIQMANAGRVADEQTEGLVRKLNRLAEASRAVRDILGDGAV